MLILRIRQAECALADGRLDEAYDLASRDDVRRHRRGQRLLGHLVALLVERGQAHLEADRFTLALADCDRAGRLGGNQAAIAALRAAATAQMSCRQRRNSRQQQLLAEAGRQVEQGRLSMCEHLLDGIAETGGAGGAEDAAAALRHAVAQRRAAAEAALTQARDALSRGDFDAVIAALLEAGKVQQPGQKLAELRAELTRAVVDRVRNEINRGRLDLAQALLDRFALLSDDNLDVAELDHMVDLCHSAQLGIQRGQMDAACQAIEQLARVAPEATWVGQTLEHLRQAAAACAALGTGPLGLLAPTPALPEVDRPQGTDSAADLAAGERPIEPPRMSIKADNASALPDRFLLQVDGAGCCLVVRSAAVTIGPVSSSRLCDVGLLAQANLPVALIERLDDDYFLRSDGAVRVNDKAATSRLLAHGDRIALSARCTLKYRLPHAASTSALLDLTGARLPRADVGKVILLDRSIVLAPGKAGHIRADELAGPAVLHLRNGQLHYQGDLAVKVGDRRLAATEALVMGAPIRIGPLSMVLTKV